MKKVVCFILVFFGLRIFSAHSALALTGFSMGERAIADAMKILNLKRGDDNFAVLTNAGYTRLNGRTTRPLLDIISRKTGLGMGKNLLNVHSDYNAPLWMAFVCHRPERERKLPLVLVRVGEDGVQIADPVNVYVEKGTSFEPFKKVLGENAFALVTLANGWIGDLPDDLIQGALFHDHFCCGVATGYFTARFIAEKIPLSKGENYTYLGFPSWCQDDYIINYLNLTPGKKGYYSMKYPWARIWKTDSKTYPPPGGIILCYDRKKGRGKAYVLSFDWNLDDFRKCSVMPDEKIDWHKKPWLHVLYNRYLVEGNFLPEKFVSIIGTKEINRFSDYERLVRMGANPLEEILGKDSQW